MPARFTLLMRPFFGLVALLALLALNGVSRGQLAEDTLEKEHSKHRVQLSKLLSGAEPFDAKNKDHLAAIDTGAKYTLYRFTWVTIANSSDSGKIDAVFRDFEEQLKAIQRNKTNYQEVANAYTKAIVVRGEEVLSQNKPIARVNAARVLAKVAELGQGELADELLKLLTQELARPQAKTGAVNEGVLYYLFMGMRELLALPAPAPPGKPIVSEERQKKLAEALQAFINKAPGFAADTPQEEIAGYRALRREAVRALSYCRIKELDDKDRPALTLLHVAARQGLTPEPRLDESLEAALGLARLRPATEGKAFQADYAAHVLGQFVEGFGAYYVANKDKEQRPYRIYAARLLEALEAMKAEIKDAYVGEVVDQCRKVLTPIEKGEPAKTTSLRNWLDMKRPAKEGLFQGVAESVVKPLGEPAAAAP